MTSRRAAGFAALSILLLSACGGGGGGGGGGPPQASVSIAQRSVSASASYAEYAPTRTIVLTAANVPDTGLYVGVGASNNGIESVDFQAVSETQGNLVVQFRSPLDLSVGAFTDQIQVQVCHDDQCARQVVGSPITVSSSYVVNSPTTASLPVSTVTASATVQQGSAPQASALINLANTGTIPPMLRVEGNYTSLYGVSGQMSSANTIDVQVSFRHASTLTTGVYNEQVVLRVCYDSNCRREVNGSPFVLQTTYSVAFIVPPEEGVPALPYLTRTTLSHDVIDAEYSAALNAIVMVSAKPTSSLYIYDTATGVEREVRLNRAPTAVSISPDGQTAAVGHDALLSVVELASAGQPGAPAPVALNLSADAFDVVLDGRGFVHAFPRVDQWVVPHSVEIAANVERLGVGSLYAGSRAKLHPSGNFVYTANNGLSPSDIAKYDIGGSSAVELYDSPYHGDYAMCGDLWMKEDGAVIYTRCGNTFRSSTTQAQDMIYNGRLQLSEVTHGFFIDALSQSDATDEIALLESPWYSCTFDQSGCYSHLNLYESEFLNRTAMYSLAPVTVDANTYSQRGLFVFHSADGLHRYLISRLSQLPGENQPYYLTVLQ